MESSWYTVGAHNLKLTCLLSWGFPQRLKEAFESSKPGRRTRKSLKVRVPPGPRVPGGAAPPADRGGGRGTPPRSAKALSRKVGSPQLRAPSSSSSASPGFVSKKEAEALRVEHRNPCQEPLICASVAEKTRIKTLWVRSPGPWVSAIGVLLELPWADRSVSPPNIIPGWEHDFPVSMPTILSPHTRARKNLLTLRAPVSFNPAQEEGEEFEEQNSRTSQENGPGWNEAQAQHRGQLLPSAGGRLIYAVRESAAWGPRGVRIWERKL